MKNITLSLKYCWSKVSAVMYLYCARDFQLPFLKIELENLLLQFLSNRPETFRIYVLRTIYKLYLGPEF